MRCSIIIINYNYGKYVREAVDSALNQTYPDCEVLVVDDGSTDHSAEVLSEYKDRVVTVFQENGGVLSATNAGFDKCSGDLVFFLDADDYYDPGLVEEVVRNYNPALSYVCWRMRMVASNREALGDFPVQREGPDVGPAAWKGVLERGMVNYPPTSANAYSKWALEKVFPLPVRPNSVLWADVHMFNEMPFLGEVLEIQKVMSNYRVHDSNHWYRPDMFKGKGGRFSRFRKKDAAKYQASIVKNMEIYNILDRGRMSKTGEWGRGAKRMWYRQAWRRFLSKKCISGTHPIPSDTLADLAREIMRWCPYSGARFALTRLKLSVMLMTPSCMLRPLYFKPRRPFRTSH